MSRPRPRSALLLGAGLLLVAVLGFARAVWAVDPPVSSGGSSWGGGGFLGGRNF